MLMDVGCQMQCYKFDSIWQIALYHQDFNIIIVQRNLYTKNRNQCCQTGNLNSNDNNWEKGEINYFVGHQLGACQNFPLDSKGKFSYNWWIYENSQVQTLQKIYAGRSKAKEVNFLGTYQTFACLFIKGC